jgi:DnaJ like chaperone protein
MMGKLLGAMIGGGLGMVLAWSPPLALTLAAAGALIGHFAVDREPLSPKTLRPPSREELLDAPPRPAPRRPAPARRPTRVAAEDLLLLDALCPLFIEVARADAPASQLEIRVVREFFEQRLQFDEQAMEAVRKALKDAINAEVQDIEFLTTRARSAVKPSLRVEVVRSLYDLGLVDGALQRSEQDTLKRIVSLFNLSDEQLLLVTKEYFGSGDKAYAVLGLTSAATDDELKAAFRRLAAEHHPDRAASLGASEAARAAERFREVKDAYDELKRLRGLV